MQGLRILTLLLVLILILTLQLSGDSKAAIDHNNAGITLAKEGRWEKTWTELGEARRLDTQAADTYYRRGLAHADLGQHQKALEDYDEALRNDPNYAFAYNTAIA